MVRNSGIKYGVECIGTNNLEYLPGSGCNNPEIIFKSRDNDTSTAIGNHWVSTYDILIDVPQNSDYIEALLAFSHDVNLTNIEISGMVHLHILLSKLLHLVI